MNAIMNEKGRQTKLLAAIAVIAMVVCALAVTVPGVDAADENNANLAAADSYTYSGDTSYTYNGTRTVSGDAVWMTYSGNDKIDVTNADNSMTPIMNDFARFMGALYYNTTAKVDSIIFNGATYTWNSESDLMGSNWFNGETSLVSAAGSYIVANASAVMKTGCIPMTLVVGETQTQVTYGIAGAAIVNGTDIYMSLSAAVNAAADGATVTLVSSNITYATLTVDKSLTIDGQDNTFTGKIFIDTTSEGSAFTVTIQNIKMVGNGGTEEIGIYTTYQGSAAGSEDSAIRDLTLNMSGVSVDGYGSKGVYLTNVKTLSVDNCQFNNNASTTQTNHSGDYAFDINLCGVTGVSIEIRDSTFGGVSGGNSPVKITQRGGVELTDDTNTDILTDKSSTVASVVIEGCSFDVSEKDNKAPMADVILGSSPNSDGTVRTYNQAFNVDITAGPTDMTVGYRGATNADPAIVFNLPVESGNLQSVGTIVTPGADEAGKKITGEVAVSITSDVTVVSGAVPAHMTLSVEGQNATAVSDATNIPDADSEIEVVYYTGSTISMATGTTTEKTLVFNQPVGGTVNLTGEGAAVLSGADSTGLTVTTTDADGKEAKSVITNVAGNFTITVGSIVMGGETITEEDAADAGTVEITGDASVDGSFTLGDNITMTIKSGTFEVPAGAVLNINGDLKLEGTSAVVNNGTINVTGSIVIPETATFTNNGQIYTATFTNNGQIYTSSNNNITGTVKGNAITQGLGLSTNMDAIASDLPLSGYAFLTSDLTIPAGKSISVNGGATLDLRGYTLTVLGTLNVASNGTVIDSGADATKGIKVGTNGIINNSGIIGSTNAPVTISLADGEDGSVTLANVNGLSFGYKRVVGNNDVDYYLAISGDATKRGQYDGKITVNGTVYANAALTIGSKVDMTVATGKLVLDNGVELTVSSSGTASGKVELGVNSVVDVDGKADITVTAKTGDYQANLGTSNLTDSSVEISNVKGIEVTMTSESYSKDNALWMKQRLDVSGAMDNAVDGAAEITFTGDYVTVTGTLTVNKDITSWTNRGTVTVTGTVSWNEDDVTVGGDIRPPRTDRPRPPTTSHPSRPPSRTSPTPTRDPRCMATSRSTSASSWPPTRPSPEPAR